MSLINEALKKAQRQRAAETGGIAPASQEPLPSTPQTPIHRRRNPLAAQTVVLITIGCVLLLGGGVATAFLLFSPDSPPEVAAAPRPPTPPTVATPVVSSPAVLPAPEPIAVPEPSPLAPIVAVPLPEPPASAAIPVPPQPPVAPTPVPSVTPPAPVVTPAPAPTPTLAPTPAPNTPTEGPPKADPRVYVFLDKIRVAGIRASDDDPRVLMNDRMYRLNDMVEPVLQLRLTGISSLALTFTGPNGFVYTRNF